MPGRPLQEVGPSDFQRVIDEALELGGTTDRQMPLEDDPVKTGQNPGDQAGKLDEERAYCLHGIRFLNDCLVTIILESRMPVFILCRAVGEAHVRSSSPKKLSHLSFLSPDVQATVRSKSLDIMSRTEGLDGHVMRLEAGLRRRPADDWRESPIERVGASRA